MFTKTTISLLAICFIVMPILPQQVQAQNPLENNTTACTTDECEVILRQYTLFPIFWSLSIRCYNANGSYGNWRTWEEWGVYSGSICNGVVPN